MMPLELLSSSEEETDQLGKKLAQQLSRGDILALRGDLGAGKTTLIKGIVSGALEINPAVINSPTFTYLNIYPGEPTFYHFDLYRLKDEKDFFTLGFVEFLDAGGICCIEWPERIQKILPKKTIWIHLIHQDKTKRALRWA
ncbi:MAG TPA: tRNA (adenosine(37)-N6)-threonylcarbamoyltransferase complex ATPase subunit type 1 TsaE [Rhabdochlamydiaceae bacterium]|nr:tRNA (adenosine(37)-N6)-threonylcarbamoyltransferase complex ATPase subunit type 1 TsaE [Rhabdochlamydiaceae bacterium]